MQLLPLVDHCLSGLLLPMKHYRVCPRDLSQRCMWSHFWC